MRHAQIIERVTSVNSEGVVDVLWSGAAQLMNKLNGEDFNDADEQLFEVRKLVHVTDS